MRHEAMGGPEHEIEFLEWAADAWAGGQWRSSHAYDWSPVFAVTAMHYWLMADHERSLAAIQPEPLLEAAA